MSAPRPPEGRDRGSTGSEGDGSRRRRKKLPPEPQLRIHVHLREKTVEINAGTGGQRVFWLGVTGVQRYLVEPDSYTRPYSEELTPKVRRSLCCSLLLPLPQPLCRSLCRSLC